LTEFTADWLAGYEGSRPVRIGNAAFGQLQLDVYGELMDTFQFARRMGLKSQQPEWHIQLALLEYLETAWKSPDRGIWEVRGPARPFTHSKVMAWVAFDRAVKAIEQFHLEGPAERWRRIRDEIHGEVCKEGFNPQTGTFVQYYGGTELDASLLMIPLVGFLPAKDPRMRATIEAIEERLLVDGFVQRYPTRKDLDGLPGDEGAFLACSFWLVDNLVLLGREDDAVRLFERLAGLTNDLGLLSEEYDPRTKRLIGNYPQAFSHMALVNSAFNLARGLCAASHRQG
jgi:GH15 family glucan-1,4-alpha-glucosidase